MALPPTARSFPVEGALDPEDVLDYAVGISQGEHIKDMLQPGEAIVEFKLTLPLEARASGLEILDMATDLGFYSTRMQGRVIYFWLRIAVEFQGLPLFSASGTSIPIRFRGVTDNEPPRVVNATFLVPSFVQ